MNWILCPVRNALRYTKPALETFLAQDVGDVAVLFINNASTDGTTEWLNSISDPRVFVSHQTRPLSVAASWNFGLRWLFDPQPIPMRNTWRPPLAEYALVVNNDVLLRPDTYRWLRDDGGLFVTAVGNDDPKSIAELMPEKVLDLNLHTGRIYKYPPPTMPKRNHPDFSCYLIRRECWQRVGPFNADFSGAYCEDADYHLRMHREGIEACCIDLPFYHVASGTSKESSEKEREEIGKRADENRARFRALYGCDVGSPEYYALFSAAVVETEAPRESCTSE